MFLLFAYRIAKSFLVENRKLFSIIGLLFFFILFVSHIAFVGRSQKKSNLDIAEQLRKYVRIIAQAPDARSFFYDGTNHIIHNGSSELAEMLHGLDVYKLIYPVILDDHLAGYVFVTESSIGFTKGYLVTLGTKIPSRHRPGAFHRLERIDLDDPVNDILVFFFESR